MSADRFASLAGVRSYSGLVPALDASGTTGRAGGPTKRGDACLREALFNAADHARRIDPTLAKRYHRLMTEAGKHHNSAICTIAATLLTRLVACWRSGKPYVLRDLDGTVLSVRGSQGDRRRALHGPTRGPGATAKHGASSRQGWDEPAKQGVTERLVDRPVPGPRYRWEDLTPIRNSTAASSATPASPRA
jgi:hypothetical protein